MIVSAGTRSGLTWDADNRLHTVDLGGGMSADPDVIQQVINMVTAERDKMDHVIELSKALDNTVAPGGDPVSSGDPAQQLGGFASGQGAEGKVSRSR